MAVKVGSLVLYFVDLHLAPLPAIPINPGVHRPPGRCASALAETAGGCPVGVDVHRPDEDVLR